MPNDEAMVEARLPTTIYGGKLGLGQCCWFTKVECRARNMRNLAGWNLRTIAGQQQTQLACPPVECAAVPGCRTRGDTKGSPSAVPATQRTPPSARHVRPLRVIDNVKHPYMVTDIRLEVATQVPVRMVRHVDDGGLPSVWHVIQCSTGHMDTLGNDYIAHRHLPCR